MHPETRGALHGIVVCDFTWVGAGPIATNILAQFGADVIKIESGRRPDLLRLTGPFKDAGAGGLERSGYFANRNPNKRSISLNMEHPAAREAALRLIRKSDIVINNFRVGQMEKWGLGWEAVRRHNPRAIYVTMSLQGTTGPHASFMGFGVNLNALCGLTAQTGAAGRRPYGTGTHYTDHVAVPGHALFGVMAALLQRERTGEGQTVEISQLAASIAMKPMDAMTYTSNGTIPGPAGLADPDAAPHGVYATNKPRRWLALAVFSEEEWQALKQVMGRPRWAEDPRFGTLAARKHDEDALNEGIEQWTQGWEAEALQAGLNEKGICAGVVHDGRSVIEDEHLKARGFWKVLDHPVVGKTLYNRAPFLLSETPLRLERAAPLLGEHTEEVLVEMLGYTTDEVARMERQGALE